MLTESDLGLSKQELVAILGELRIAQYFQPPLDEFILSVSSLNNGSDSGLLLASTELSRELKHPFAPPTLIGGSDTDDPLEVARILAHDKRLIYKGKVAYVTESGREVVHEIETRPQGAWLRKVNEFASLLTKLRGLLGVP